MAAVACGSSPTSPTGGAIASVTFSNSTVATGGQLQATVTLAAAAGSAGATVTLSSSNTKVATVPSAVTVAAGATTGNFTVNGVGAGSATVTASLNGASLQSSALSVTAGPAIASITLVPASVVGGTNATATIALTGPAPAGGAAVTMSSDGTVIVPAIVTVDTGATSMTFNVLTQVVSSPVNATIKGTYGGVTATATLALTRASTATANFGVTGSTVTETCTVINSGTALDCTFNASTSSSPGNITAYDWTWSVSGTPKTQTTTNPIFTTPSFSCSMLPPPPLPATGSLTMTVTLKIHDDAGNVSPVVTDSGVRLLPQGSCGY